MAVELSPSGFKIFTCDVCSDLGITTAWLGLPGKGKLPTKCAKKPRHSRWNYRAQEAKKKKQAEIAKRRAAKGSAKVDPVTVF
jgi:hypothetical protein